MRPLQSILLTGGAGFIGSALARHLLRHDGFQRLVILDNLSATGHRGNIAELDHDPRFTFVEGDITDQPLVAHLITSCALTGVINLAAQVQGTAPLAAAVDFAATNITGPAHLLEVCRLTGATLLQASTAEVYGPVAPPTRATEEAPYEPSTPCIASKAAADLMCLAARRASGQDVVITRGTYTWGPRQTPEEFIPTVVRHAIHDEAVPLQGHGMQIRDWLHVDDHCRGMIQTYVRGSPGAIFNLGAGCERTNLGVGRNVLDILGKPTSLLTPVPGGKSSEARYAVDSSKALRYFGWLPEVSMPDAIGDLVREMAANLTAARR